MLAASNNRNAVYLCEQAAEKIIRAVLTSEGQHAGIKHDLAEMVDLIPAENPLKAHLRKIEHLSRYATAYRYPVSSSKTKRIAHPPSASELRAAIDDTAAALDRAVASFGVDLHRTDAPARHADPLRQKCLHGPDRGPPEGELDSAPELIRRIRQADVRAIDPRLSLNKGCETRECKTDLPVRFSERITSTLVPVQLSKILVLMVRVEVTDDRVRVERRRILSADGGFKDLLREKLHGDEHSAIVIEASVLPGLLTASAPTRSRYRRV